MRFFLLFSHSICSLDLRSHARLDLMKKPSLSTATQRLDNYRLDLSSHHRFASQF
ncbi:hypothetical protein BJX62DRAFT_200944 [Aspergillus germanicus]